MAFRLINLFCRLAGNLAEERDAFYQAVADCNGKEGMPRGVLFAPLSTGSYSPERKAAVDSNIRLSQFFLPVVEDIREVPVGSFLRDYRLAMKCLADPAFPMRQAAVLLKPAPSGEEPGDLTRFRAELAAVGAPCLFEFATPLEFGARLAPWLSPWLAAALAAKAAPHSGDNGPNASSQWLAAALAAKAAAQ